MSLQSTRASRGDRRNAYVNGIHAAESEGFAMGKAGLDRSACRYKRYEHEDVAEQ
jgi:hypothetical protein